MAVESFMQQQDGVLMMKNDLRLRDVLAYFISCRADLSLIKLTYLQKLLLGIAGNNSEGLVNYQLLTSTNYWLKLCDIHIFMTGTMILTALQKD